MKRHYKAEITVNINDKGVIDLDVVKGCALGIKDNPNGCYGLCYAKKCADFRGIDFGVSVSRMPSEKALKEILKIIRNSDLPFVRIGTMGEPCHDWSLTVLMCKFICRYKPVVIITKHWIALTDEQMKRLGQYKVIINTSISPLDRPEQIKYRLEQYKRYKKFGTSILRIVSCDFNLENTEGKRLNKIQKDLFKNKNIIDNPLRCPTSYPMVKEGIIKVKKVWDLNSEVYMSKFNPDTYVGRCDKCPELCGLLFVK